MILALQTTTFGVYGGIPTYNRLVCRVLDEIGDRVESRVLIATDGPTDIERGSIEFPKLFLQGFKGHRIALAARFLRLALSRRFDLALIGHVNYAPLGLLLKQLQPQIRYGVMLYGIEAWQRLPRLRAQALRRADFMISISDYTRQRAIEANGLAADRICLLPNALEAEGNNDDVAQSTRLAGARLLSVCRLDQSEQYKGVDKVIEVLAQVAQVVPDVQYTVIGGGTDLDRHRQLAENLGVAERVKFLGSVDDETLRASYRECDLFVLPSAGEGFGFVFLEAMKFGKAVVAANSGGAPEVVEDGVTGRLVEYGDQSQLAQTLTDLLVDPDLRRQLGAAGQAKLQSRFGFTRFRETFTEILQRQLPSTVIGSVALPPSMPTQTDSESQAELC